MNIQDIAGCRVKLSPRSITVLNDKNKTAGVVRNAERFSDAPPRVTSEFWNQIRGLRDYRLFKFEYCYISEGRLYYINNLKTVDFYNGKRFAAVLQEEAERFKAWQDVLTAAAGIVVINAYII